MDRSMRDRAVWRKLGLAGVILFAPGGFILGAALIADHYRRRATDAGGAPPD